MCYGSTTVLALPCQSSLSYIFCCQPLMIPVPVLTIHQQNCQAGILQHACSVSVLVWMHVSEQKGLVSRPDSKAPKLSLPIKYAMPVPLSHMYNTFLIYLFFIYYE